MRRRAKHNPDATTWLVLGGGVALVGVAAYFIWRKPAAAAGAQQLPPSGDAAKAAPPPPNLGDVNDVNSIAYACAAAHRLNAIGHPTQAAPWAAKCQAGGGVVPA